MRNILVSVLMLFMIFSCSFNTVKQGFGLLGRKRVLLPLLKHDIFMIYLPEEKSFMVNDKITVDRESVKDYEKGLFAIDKNINLERIIVDKKIVEVDKFITMREGYLGRNLSPEQTYKFLKKNDVYEIVLTEYNPEKKEIEIIVKYDFNDSDEFDFLTIRGNRIEIKNIAYWFPSDLSGGRSIHFAIEAPKRFYFTINGTEAEEKILKKHLKRSVFNFVSEESDI
ncbi:MAG: hypothetical protein CSB55_08835 [Candidatus Cloacimonadota bacterium]|nr:MAG: hypothetical protein CSB55_08835 [Candidatus Cloacimonadota bacterium]